MMTKFVLKTVFLIALFFLCILAGLHTFVRIKGKQILSKKLAAVFQSDVSIGSVSTGFPLSLVVSDVEVKDWFKIRKVLGGMGLVDLFSEDFILTSLELKGLAITLEKRPEPKPEAGTAEGNAAAGGQASQPQEEQKNPPVLPVRPHQQQVLPLPPRILIKRLIVSDGVVGFVDYSRADQPVRISLKDFNAEIESIRWPLDISSVTFFTVRAGLPWETGAEQGRISFDGWINPLRKDMRATLDVRDIDGIALYPYYRDWVTVEKDRIAKARLNFSSNITSLNNDVNAACHLELTQIEFKQREAEESEHRIEKMINVVIGLFKAMDEGKIVLDFNFKTKLDNPEFGLLGVIESALKTKVQSARPAEPPAEQIINFPGKVLKGTITGTADLTKALINGTVGVGKELTKAVGASFTREENATEATAEDAAGPPVNATNATQ